MSLSEPEWETKARPAVVLEVESLKGDTSWRVTVLPLRREIYGKEMEGNQAIRILPQRLSSGAMGDEEATVQ